MRLISPLLKHVIYPGLARTGHFRPSADAGPTVLTYHGILPPEYKSVDDVLDGGLITAGSFRRQIEMLTQQYRLVSPREFLAWSQGRVQLPVGAILLTCDDGLRNVLQMLPVLKDAGAACLFFVTGMSLQDRDVMLWHEELYLLLLRERKPMHLRLPGFGEMEIGAADFRHSWWNLVEHLSSFGETARREAIEEIRSQASIAPGWKEDLLKSQHAKDRFCLLGPSGLRRLLDAGHTVGAHSISHALLSRLSSDEVRREMVDCGNGLEKVSGEKSWAFAYPFGNPGSVHERDFLLAESAGFSCAFLNTEDSPGIEPSVYAFPRVHVTSQMSLPELQAHISGFHNRLRHSFRRSAGV